MGLTSDRGGVFGLFFEGGQNMRLALLGLHVDLLLCVSWLVVFLAELEKRVDFPVDVEGVRGLLRGDWSRLHLPDFVNHGESNRAEDTAALDRASPALKIKT